MNSISNNSIWVFSCNLFTRAIFPSMVVACAIVFSGTSTAVYAQPILLAQAQETDGKIYVAEVIQVDGTKKTIKYSRDQRWVILAPPVVDGKLVDGSPAPENPVEARVAQKKILVKYDKGALLMLAYVSKQDILWEADKNLDEILSLSENWKTISKTQLFNWFYSAYIYNISMQNWKADSIISTLESIAKIRMRLSATELTQIKQDAKLKAIEIWKSVTGAISVDDTAPKN